MPLRSPLSERFDPSRAKVVSNEEVVICEKCGCKWMKLIQVFQYPMYHGVVLGQKPPALGDGFWLFECPKCRHTIEPSVISGPRDSARSGYDEFIDQLTKVEPETKTEGEDV